MWSINSYKSRSRRGYKSPTCEAEGVIKVQWGEAQLKPVVAELGHFYLLSLVGQDQDTIVEAIQDLDECRKVKAH